MSVNVKSTVVWDTSDLERFIKTTFPKIREDASQEAGKRASDAGVTRFRMLVRVDTGSLRKSGRRWTLPKPPNLLWTGGVRAGGYVVNPKTGRLVDYAKRIENLQEREDSGGAVKRGTLYASSLMPVFMRQELKRRLRSRGL